jgi:hypothetical protein
MLKSSADIINEFNPHHDEGGRFSTADKATFVTTKTKSGKDVSHIAKKHATKVKKPTGPDPRNARLPESHPVHRMSPEHQKEFHDAYDDYSKAKDVSELRSAMKSRMGSDYDVGVKFIASWQDSSDNAPSMIVDSALRRIGLSHPSSDSRAKNIDDIVRRDPFYKSPSESDVRAARAVITDPNHPKYNRVDALDAERTLNKLRLSQDRRAKLENTIEKERQEGMEELGITSEDAVSRALIHTYAATQSQLKSPSYNLIRGEVGDRVRTIMNANDQGDASMIEMANYGLASHSDNLKSVNRYLKGARGGEYAGIFTNTVQREDIFTHHDNPLFQDAITQHSQPEFIRSQREFVVFGRRMRVESVTVSGKTRTIELKPL